MTQQDGTRRAQAGGRAVCAAIWLPGLAVALGAAAATAHGLHEVALAARVPRGIAWLYPLITDGLALVAYAATARLHGRARRYAWAVVVLAAGLSGLAQASLLAGDATLSAPAALRFGVGAWPALAAAIVAHLLYLLATHAHVNTTETGTHARSAQTELHALPGTSDPVSDAVSVRSDTAASDTASDPLDVCLSDAGPDTPTASAALSDAVSGPAPQSMPSASDAPARERARVAAARHSARHGELPTVRQLMTLAHVGRGTAADALKALREHGLPLHLVTDNPDTRTNR